MSKMKNCLIFILSGTYFIMTAYAQTNNPNAYALMTISDIKNNAFSNITILNNTSQSISVSGLFISSFDVNDCSSCYGSIVSGDNLGGTIISPVTFKANQSVPIGQNFLYNMIYNGIYFIQNAVGSSPCLLPGCTWPGDDPNIRGWCVTMNAISINSSYTSSAYTNGSYPPASAPPFSQAGNSTPFNYKYDLIDPNTLGIGNACLGPITCNDKTLTCQVSSAQSESFQSYS